MLIRLFALVLASSKIVLEFSLVGFLLIFEDNGFLIWVCDLKNYFWNLCFVVKANMTWQNLSRIIVSFSIFLFYYFLRSKCDCDAYPWHGPVIDAMCFCFKWWYNARFVCTSMSLIWIICVIVICWNDGTILLMHNMND